MLVDSHCHLNFDELYSDIDNYLEQMKANRVDYALCIGTRPDNLDKIIDIASTYPNIFATVGIHPDEKLLGPEVTKDQLGRYFSHPKVVGVGETGLDYYRVKDDDFTWQHQRFRMHIELAIENRLPLVIHTRNSFNDTINILREYDLTGCGVVMHCFTESLENAKVCIELGYYISISGIVTFKNARDIQDMAKYIPSDRLLVETDAPFLAPVPFRGKLNHPGLVLHTAQFLADLRGVELERLADSTTKNFFAVFAKVANYLKVGVGRDRFE